MDYQDITDNEDFLEVLNIMAVPRNRVFRERPNNFEIWNDKEFMDRFRLSKATVRVILNEIAPVIGNKIEQNHALGVEDMLFVSLRFLVTGSFLHLIGDLQGIHKGTGSNVLRAIAALSNQFIKMPYTQQERNIVAQGFYNITKFPRCIGALDRSLIKIQSPGGPNAETYRSRKNFFAFNVQCICDANLKLLNVVCNGPDPPMILQFL